MPIKMTCDGIKDWFPLNGVELKPLRIHGVIRNGDWLRDEKVLRSGEWLRADKGEPVGDILIAKYSDFATVDLFQMSRYPGKWKAVIEFEMRVTDKFEGLHVALELVEVQLESMEAADARIAPAGEQVLEIWNLTFTAIELDRVPVKNGAMHALLDQAIRRAAAIA